MRNHDDDTRDVTGWHLLLILATAAGVALVVWWFQWLK